MEFHVGRTIKQCLTETGVKAKDLGKGPTWSEIFDRTEFAIKKKQREAFEKATGISHERLLLLAAIGYDGTAESKLRAAICERVKELDLDSLSLLNGLLAASSLSEAVRRAERAEHEMTAAIAAERVGQWVLSELRKHG